MSEDTAAKLSSLQAQLGRVILGKPEAIEHVLVALLAGHHLLMEDVPGVGKTTLAKALARCFSGEFRRVQFTPDLLPADILGSSVYSPRDGSFTFKEGPVFANVLLADEINRASPRTQSALLEAMSEGQVSSEGVTRVLPTPFLVLATQNPVEFHGTYPLPEAQLDRFGAAHRPRLPGGGAGGRRALQPGRAPPPRVRRLPVLSAQDVVSLQAETRHVRVERSLGRYMVALAEATRRHPSVRLGCSPRGTLMLFRAAQARAFFEGRAFVVPEDVKTQGVPVLAHRLGLETKARYTGVSKEDIVREILDAVARPGLRPARQKAHGHEPARASAGERLPLPLDERPLPPAPDRAGTVRPVGHASCWPSSASTRVARSSSCSSRSPRLLSSSAFGCSSGGGPRSGSPAGCPPASPPAAASRPRSTSPRDDGAAAHSLRRSGRRRFP